MKQLGLANLRERKKKNSIHDNRVYRGLGVIEAKES